MSSYLFIYRLIQDCSIMETNVESQENSLKVKQVEWKKRLRELHTKRVNSLHLNVY